MSGFDNDTCFFNNIFVGQTGVQPGMVNDGELLIGDGAGNPQINTLTAGAGITIVNGAGSITISATATSFDFPVDNGGPGVPAPNMALYGPTTTDFTGSGIETHVGATTNEIYFENRRFPSAFVVDATATVGNRGEYTTITTAMAAATAGDTVYVRPGTYAENPSVTLGTSLVGLTGPGEGQKVIIAGTLNAPVGAGTSVVQNISGAAGGARGIELQGGAGSEMLFFDCQFDHPGNVCRFVSGNAKFHRCVLNSSSGPALLSETTGGGRADFFECEIISVGAVTVSQTIQASLVFDDCLIIRNGASGNAIEDTASPGGSVICNYCNISGDIECMTTPPSLEYCDIGGGFNTDDAICNFKHCNWEDTLNFDDAAVGEIHYNRIVSAGNAAISANGGAGASLRVTHATIDSTNATPVSVAVGDTLNYADIVFSNTGEGVGGGGTINTYDWKPYGLADDATVGVNAYDSTDFTVNATTGVVSLLNPSGITWQDSAPAVLTTNNGYFATGAGAYTLPTGAADGETIEIVDVVGGGVVVTAPGVQIVQIGNTASSAGGTATSTADGDALRLKFRLADVTWYCVPGAQGNWNLA